MCIRDRDMNQVGENLTDLYARFPLDFREKIITVTDKLGQYIGDAINGLSAVSYTHLQCSDTRSIRKGC